MTSDARPALPEWQQYPTIGELLVDPDRYRDLRRRCHQSCEQLDRLSREGTPEERQLAVQSLEAYGRALQFLEEVLKMRDEAVQNRG